MSPSFLLAVPAMDFSCCTSCRAYLAAHVYQPPSLPDGMLISLMLYSWLELSYSLLGLPMMTFTCKRSRNVLEAFDGACCAGGSPGRTAC